MSTAFLAIRLLVGQLPARFAQNSDDDRRLSCCKRLAQHAIAQGRLKSLVRICVHGGEWKEELTAVGGGDTLTPD